MTQNKKEEQCNSWVWLLQALLKRSSNSCVPSLVAQRVKRLPTMRETQVRSLGQEDPLEKEMTTHSSTLAWKIPWTEKPGRLQSMGSQRVGHDWATFLPFLSFPSSLTTANPALCSGEAGLNSSAHTLLFQPESTLFFSQLLLKWLVWAYHFLTLEAQPMPHSLWSPVHLPLLWTSLRPIVLFVPGFDLWPHPLSFPAMLEELSGQESDLNLLYFNLLKTYKKWSS